MNFVVTKKNKNISVYINEKKVVYKNNYCIILGNICNIDELSKEYKSENNSDKIIELYELYQDELFKKLNGEYAILLIIKDKIIIVRDRLGSKQVYYADLDGTFVCSNTLDYFIKNYKKNLNIDKQQLANYLNYSYINEPYTIFKQIYKIKSGYYITYHKSITEEKYYDIFTEYKRLKNKINNFEKAKTQLTSNLIESIRKRTHNKEKIGISLSSGIDSVLITALTKKTKKEVHTYTLGFYDKERNEAKEAKEIAKYLKTNHHEIYLNQDTAKKIVYELPKIYSEPFGDPSIIPTIYLNKFVDKDVDIILTGDAADQLFCGSNIYSYFNPLKIFIKEIYNSTIPVIFKKIPKRIIATAYEYLKSQQIQFYDIQSKSYYNLPKNRYKKQIKYMLFDIKTFLSNRLFTKVSMAANYNNIEVSHPFVDNDFIETTLKINHKFKYYKKQKKYILKQILSDNLSKELLNNKKSGFGIPLEKWLYTIFCDDIIKFSDPKSLEKQGIFSVKKLNKKIEKLKTQKLCQPETNILFSYYIFQLWYQHYIEDLWN